MNTTNTKTTVQKKKNSHCKGIPQAGKKKSFDKKAVTTTTNKEYAFDEKNDSGHGTASTTLTMSHSSPVDMMTSEDFQFDVHAHVEMIHQHLKDTIRVQKFKDAILHNQHLFKGKIVLDINCGVGIYSLFAAKAGAAKIYAIDNSNVIYYTRKVVAANGYEDVIEVLKGKVEDIELPVKQVDIIISDWMGYSLLFQSTCDAVICARDKWLKKEGGLIFPDQAKLFMVALEDRKHRNENIEWWMGVYDFTMKCIRDVALKEPRYQLIKPQQILSKQCPIKTLDLNTATKDDLKFRSKYMLPIQRTGHMDGLALYFHVYFSKSHTPLGFSTDPWCPGTNWMQTILFLDKSITVQANSIYYGGIEMLSRKSPLDLNDMVINLELLSGDPTQPDVDIEMSWDLKPTTAVREHPNSENNKEYSTLPERKSFEEKPVNLGIPNMRSATNADASYTAVANKLKSDRHAPSSTKVVQSSKGLNNDLGSQTITLGEHIYTCRKNRRNKNKHTKKG